jgi:hypothetical protein
MARGLETLWFKRHLLNPFRHGDFALMLFSHKLCRWLVHLLLPVGLVAVGLLGARHLTAQVVTALVLVGIGVGVAALRWPADRAMPRVVQVVGYLFAANLAGFQAWIQALTGDQNPIWEPTRRPG